MKRKMRLLTSMLRYISIRNFSQSQTSTNQLFSNRLLQYVQNLNDMKTQQSSIIKNLQEINKLHHLSPEESYRKLSNIDRDYAINIREFSPDVILETLCSYSAIDPGGIVRYCFYNEGLHQLCDNLNYLNAKQVVQLMYFIGLQKKTRGAQRLIKNCLRRFSREDIQSFSVEDLCVVCNSTFKTSTLINRFEILENVVDTINNNLHLLKDTGIFVTFIKTLRHNHYQNEDLLNTVSHAILFNSTYKNYSFAATCHILAFYADYYYYDKPIMDLFCDKCRDLLDEDKKVSSVKHGHASDTIRVKDIARFLWIYSSLNHDLPHDFLTDILEPSVVSRYEAGLYDKKPEILLDTIYYLWILNYQAKKIIPLCFTRYYIDLIKESKSKSKHRMNILITCMQVENLPLYKELPIHQIGAHNYNVKHQVASRPTLSAVFNVLNAMAPLAGIDEFKFECQIPYLNIVGITGYKKKIYRVVFIEVLDEFVRLRNKDEPHGSMQLKLRLLERKEQNVITITTEDVNTQSSTDLREYLADEIKSVCGVN